MSAPYYTSGTTTFPSTDTVPNPSYSTQVSAKPRVLTADFGDGYTQRSIDGINNNPQVWQVVWENLLNAEMVNLRNFLDGLAGVGAFLWSPPLDPSGGTYKFCAKDGYDWTPTDAGAGTFSVKFTQVFDLQ